MLDRPTQKQLFALVRLANSADWVDLDGLLVSELAATTDRVLNAAGDLQAIGKLQGRATLIKQFRALVAEAPEKLRSLQPTKL